MLGILAVGVVRESRKFSGHPYVGALRHYLCDCTAFLLLLPPWRNRHIKKEFNIEPQKLCKVIFVRTDRQISINCENFGYKGSKQAKIM